MEQQETPKKKNYLNLIIGCAFIAYGSYHLLAFYNGGDYSTFRLVILVGFVILGAYDLYKFYSSFRSE